MSPKSRKPSEDEDLPEIPEGYVRVHPRREEPKARKASKWWGIGGFVVAAAAVTTVIVVASLPDDPREQPGTTAEAVAGALSAHDLDGVESLLCEHAARSPEITAFYRTYGNASVLAVEDLGGGFANATLRSGARPGTDLVLQMAVEDDLWCVFGPVPCEVLGSGSSNLPLSDVCEKRPRA